MSLRDEVIDNIKARGHLRLPEPVQLASGDWSRDFVDAKRALQDGAELEKACRYMLGLLDGIDFDAIGGLTLGADQFAHGMAIVGAKQWFVVRRVAKGRGTNRRVEGAELHEGMRAVVVDDVVTTGASIREAHDVVSETGATVVGALTLLDRGVAAKAAFATLGVPYLTVATYRDLGIEPVGTSPVTSG